MKNPTTIERHTTAGGTAVYALPVEAFPNHVTNCYLVMDHGPTLIDAASGSEPANRALDAAFAEVGARFGESVRLADVGRLILTHGHVDHFGGANYVAEASGARTGIHALDASVLERFDERLIIASKNLGVFLERSGAPAPLRESLLAIHKKSKGKFHGGRADFIIEEGPLPDSNFIAHHAPGHCPGQVCLQLDDVLFSADHVLSRTTPHQSPECIFRYAGLGHYFESLAKIGRLEGIRLALGGHEFPMDDVAGRCGAIREYHEGRLEKTLALCAEPATIQDVSLGLFGVRKGYHILLALLEAGAHVEYLYERGALRVANIGEAEHHPNPAFQYQRA